MVEFIFLKNYFLSFTTKFKTTFIRLISLNNSSKFNNKINKIKNQFITFTNKIIFILNLFIFPPRNSKLYIDKRVLIFKTILLLDITKLNYYFPNFIFKFLNFF